ncbi:MAG: phosphate ABC transporter permease subunit PstC [Candidatus Liberibacter europaeus]|uniref:Phosphate transport system permease protein n=1 Tax=Candidatus Liberibacter europaeus TaxID=744859 RepID=A0A2T4VXL0_9HYPH|nr:phosphate ABC transporter permease subunit PstC [Candidatus Liberibacter europaeus]PTL86513.1 MAG: phosphate ABC transporter permease subunit PstC [Candidatus Liberibacter europaeus]
MFFLLFVLGMVPLGLMSYFIGCLRARFISRNITRLYSKESYYGIYILLYTILPCLLFSCVWLLASPYVIDNQVRERFSTNILIVNENDRDFCYDTVRKIAGILPVIDLPDREKIYKGDVGIYDLLGDKGIALVSNPEPWMIKAAFYYEDLSFKSHVLMSLFILLLACIGCFYAISNITPQLCVRIKVEKCLIFLLLMCAVLSIFISLGIVLSLFFNSLSFFYIIPAKDFFFGTVWDPRFSSPNSTNSIGQFGLIPLLIGTFYIGFVAMLFAVPIGLLIAIYMAEYASKRLRSIIKPITEILAGIPTIVYGLFALSVVGPFLRDISICMNGLITGNYINFIEAQSVLTAGLVMGIMLIPYVSSLSEDVISSVPSSLRDGSLGLGATRSETMRYVIFPAAFPGVAGAILMTASRTIGETMIVILAAGISANIQFSPFESMTTITVKIMNQLTGDIDFTSPQRLVAFALGLTLFFITFFLNMYAMYIMKKYQRKYE